MKINKLFLVAFAFFYSFSLSAQETKWSFFSKEVGEGEYELVFNVSIPANYHMYSMKEIENGPLPLVFKFDDGAYTLLGKMTTEAIVKQEMDDGFGLMVEYYEGEIEFHQRVKILEPEVTIKGTMSYQTCTEGQCLPGESDFSIKISGKSTEESTTSTVIDTKNQDSNLLFFILALLAGLASVIMPCVFPMIPMVVSFFMSGSASKSVSLTKGLIFGISITAVYTSIGVIVALTQNASFASVMSTHWIPNLIFFTLFLAFSLSFFGMFEITLPTGLANKADRQVDKGGYMASFFLAVVLAIVSFSCTGPFVGGILVQAARGGMAIKPIIGMAGFGLGLGLPFVIFSMAPSLIQKLPKSGGWLNTVKIFFAFILLAFSIKFLDIAESNLGFNFVTRDAFIAVWIVIAILLGMYVLGKIKFAHDNDIPHVSVARLFVAIACFSFAVYLIPGLFGARLSSVSAIMPSYDDQEFDISSINYVPSETSRIDGPKYSDFLTLPKGVNGYFDLEEGLEVAKATGKPVLLDFKGHRCGNCKKMDNEIFSNKEVVDLLNQEFVVIGLYTDDNTELPEDEWITVNGKVKKTIGQVNSELESTKYGQVAQPYFIIVDEKGNPISSGMSYESDPSKFIEWLKSGLK